MRYPASEKLEIIRLVEQSHLPVRRTLEKLGILPGYVLPLVRSLSNRRRRSAGRQAVEADRASGTAFPTTCAGQIIELALDEPELSPRELAARFTDTQKLLRLGSLGLSPAQGP